MASYTVNERAVARARRLIRARQYVLNSDWGDVQPKAKEGNAFLASHSWSEYAERHLGLTEGAADETKARYAFVYGDFRRLHRTGLIACTIERPSGGIKRSSSRLTSCYSCWIERPPEELLAGRERKVSLSPASVRLRRDHPGRRRKR